MDEEGATCMKEEISQYAEGMYAKKTHTCNRNKFLVRDCERWTSNYEREDIVIHTLKSPWIILTQNKQQREVK